MLKNCLSYFLFMFLFYYCCRTKTCDVTDHKQKTTLPLVLRELFYILSKSNIFYFINQLKQLIVFNSRCLTYFKILLVRTVYVIFLQCFFFHFVFSKLFCQLIIKCCHSFCDMVKHELPVTSWKLKGTSWNSKYFKVASSNPRVTSLNPQVYEFESTS